MCISDFVQLCEYFVYFYISEQQKRPYPIFNYILL